MKDSVTHQAVVIKLSSSEQRVSIFCARMTFKDSEVILLHLSRCHAALLLDVKKIFKDQSNIMYAFVDRNCRLGLRFTGGELCFFISQEQFQALL